MFKIALINLPFASVNYPSIALAQLRSCLDKELGNEVETDIFHFNHHFRKYFGKEVYASISHSIDSTVAGLGDWMFRQAAYPKLEDHVDEYFQRYPSVLQEFNVTSAFFKELKEGINDLLAQLITIYHIQDYDLVGFTSMFQQNMASFAMARQLKQLNSAIITVMGGANCESPMGTVIARHIDSIDFVFSGPALKSFPQVIKHLVKKEPAAGENVKGVFTKNKLMQNPANYKNEIGDVLDINVRLSLEYKDYFVSIAEVCPDVTPSILFETSHGCWWGQKYQCTFCGENPAMMNYCSMSPENAINQFNQILNYYPQTKQFLSVDKVLPRDYVTKVLPYIKIPDDACILYEVRPDLKESELAILAKAGISRVQVGIESLSTNTLKLMKKGNSSFKNILFLKNCLTYQINPDWNLLVGFPGENEEPYQKYAEIIPKLFHLPPPSGIFPIHFDRFSPYFYFQQEYNLNLQPYDFYKIIYPFSEEDIKDFAYYFNDQNYNKECYIAVAKWINKLRELVGQWRSRWKESERGNIPNLTYDSQDAQDVILDTRDGSMNYYQINSLELDILDCLKSPLASSDLQTKLTDNTLQQIDICLNSLYERGLVFKENNRYISLVIDDEFEQGLI